MRTQIEQSDIHTIAPECVRPDSVVPVLQQTADQFGISENYLRLAAFLAQVAVESQGLNRVRENLYFSHAERIQQVWPTHFATVQAATPYVRNPTDLGNFVYANRMGNGSVQSGDGYRYRGGGFIQTTGRLNYSVTGSALGIPLAQHPELIEERAVAAKSAGYFWQSHGLNELADKGDFVEITKIINGGLTGLADRAERYRKALELFA